MNVYTASKSRLRLGRELARGGEAVVYRIDGRDKQLAKIYSKPRPDYHDKMRFMRDTPPSDPTLSLGHASIAWPRDLLYDGQQRFVGYVMPYIDHAVPIVSVFNPRRRARVLPGFDGAYLLRAGRNLSSALAALHSRAYVVGDLNERNVLVTPRALVTLIDTDSFQVRHPSGARIIVYPCPVGRSEYTPPELQGMAFKEVLRLPEHDCFGLAVLLFQLTMSGSHPFRGLWRGAGEPPPIEQRIKNGWFPYGPESPKELVPPPDGPSLDQLHPGVADLFARCFADGHRNPARRPTAVEWARALAEAERHMIVCKGGHPHADHLRRCPTCGAGRRLVRSRSAVPQHTAAPEPPIPGTVAPAGSGAVVAAATPSPTAASALTRLGLGFAAPFVATGRAAAGARRTLARSVADARTAAARLPQRLAVGALFHATRPRATAEAARSGVRRVSRHAGLAVVAAAVGMGAVVALESGGALAVWTAAEGPAPGAVALVVTGLAMAVVGAFRGLADAPQGRVDARITRAALIRSASGVAGAAVGWSIMALLLGIVTGSSVSQLALAPAAIQVIQSRMLGWVLGWALYGAVAGAFGGTLRATATGWALSGTVFGAVGMVALRLALPFLS